ncbi:hypothetical protein VCR31J2_1270283 [Vibrio coralliirubri]|uniref:Uncharacterized protein n=1 Tax=Vibrio coralliirubri TaxID=1516159 RepID=A0AA87BYY2_9VIBR|nr:hypothetical protein VCR31J2_1270283 [Vibrio coralliirubri]
MISDFCFQNARYIEPRYPIILIICSEMREGAQAEIVLTFPSAHLARS